MDCNQSMGRGRREKAKRKYIMVSLWTENLQPTNKKKEESVRAHSQGPKKT